MDMEVQITDAFPGDRCRPVVASAMGHAVLKQVLPWRSLNSAAEIEPKATFRRLEEPVSVLASPL
jgi:hypothetical protein